MKFAVSETMFEIIATKWGLTLATRNKDKVRAGLSGMATYLNTRIYRIKNLNLFYN